MKTIRACLTVSIFAALAGCGSTAATPETDQSGGAATAQSTLTDDQILAQIKTAAQRDVNKEHVSLPPLSELPAPTRSVGSANAGGASLYGVDWFQQWPGGANADHDWQKGTEEGKRCMWAAIYRFEAVFKNPPAEFKQFLRDYSKWNGSFYNWVDDFSRPESEGDAEHAKLWAWRTGLSKWISATARDGSCFLPTKTMVKNYIADCKQVVATTSSNGEMQGCSVNW